MGDLERGNDKGYGICHSDNKAEGALLREYVNIIR